MSTNDANPAVTPDDDVEVSLYESRKKIQTRSVTGTFTSLRWAAVWFTQILFYALPWFQLERPAGGPVRPRCAPFLSLIHI